MIIVQQVIYLQHYPGLTGAHRGQQARDLDLDGEHCGLQRHDGEGGRGRQASSPDHHGLVLREGVVSE